MTPVQHNPNCAIVRTGDIRAWCDCGAEIPALNEIRANVMEKIGAGKERAAIVRWLRTASNGDDTIKHANVFADEIEEGKHNNEKL